MTLTQEPTSPSMRQAGAIDRHLVIVHRRGWQSPDDWREIATRVRRFDPGIAVFLVSSDDADSPLALPASKLPTLVFSASPLGQFKPLRGKVYQGQLIHKATQLKRLSDAGLPVPPTAILSPQFVSDPAILGPLVVLKPTDIVSSSQSQAIQLMRTEKVRYVPPESYPEGHPGRRGPMLVQKFIDTGPRMQGYRVLTLFGEPLLCETSELAADRVPLAAEGGVLEHFAIQGAPLPRNRQFIYRADVVHLARRVHKAMPEVALKEVDIIREAGTGRLFVLEVNPGGNTWHFSSDVLAARRGREAPDQRERRLKQLDAFGTAALVLARVTRAEAQ